MRLRYAYFIKCVDVIKDETTGEIVELHCTYDPATRGGNAPDGRKVKGTLHWVSARHAIKATVRLYDRLFTRHNPNEAAAETDFTTFLNPNSLETRHARLEPSLAAAAAGHNFQFERLGYFCLDSVDASEQEPVFNRTVTLRDAWAKIEKARQEKGRPRKKR